MFTRDKYLIKSGGREIDFDRVSEYKSLLSPRLRKFANLIISNVKYITFNQLISDMDSCFDDFADKIRDKPFKILNETRKLGSSQWLTNIFQQRIETLNFEGFITEKFKEPIDFDILVIDDFSCTGVQLMKNVIETFLAEYFYIDYNGGIIDKSSLQNFTFHFIIPYLSQRATNRIVNTLNHYSDELGIKINYNIYTSAVKITSLYDLMTENPIVLQQYQSFGIQDMYACLIYFDHKIGNSFASVPNILVNGFVPNQNINYGSLLIDFPDESGKKEYIKAMTIL